MAECSSRCGRCSEHALSGPASGDHGVVRDHHPTQPGEDARPLPAGHTCHEAPDSDESEEHPRGAEPDPQACHPDTACHADTVRALTHLVCRTPGRFGAMIRAETRGHGGVAVR